MGKQKFNFKLQKQILHSLMLFSTVIFMTKIIYFVMGILIVGKIIDNNK